MAEVVPVLGREVVLERPEAAGCVAREGEARLRVLLHLPDEVAEPERDVAARPQGQVQVGLLGRFGAARIDADQFGPLAFGLLG